MKISIGSDHGGFEYKEAIKQHLLDGGYQVIDNGTNSKASCHYPVISFATAEKVASGEAEFGIVVCTSGEGISIAANKVKGILCAIGYDDHVSEFSRRHNNANMIAFGQAQMALEDVLRRVDIFLQTPFEGGRHADRVQLITDYENRHSK